MEHRPKIKKEPKVSGKTEELVMGYVGACLELERKETKSHKNLDETRMKLFTHLSKIESKAKAKVHGL